MIKNVFLLAALSLCLFQSCDNDDNEPVPGYVLSLIHISCLSIGKPLVMASARTETE